MELSSIFKDSSSVINSIKQILSNDKELSNLLGSAGGVFSLIGFSYEMYKRIRDKLKTDEEKALLALIHISLAITEKILYDIQNKKELKTTILKKEINKKELINDLLSSFTNEENWDSYLTEHPAITEFKSKIKNILSSNIGVDDRTINYYFIFKFDIYLIKECKKNEEIQKIQELRLIEEKYENTINFLEYLSNENNSISPYNNKPLSEYFIEQNSVSTKYDTWEKDENVFNKSNKMEISKVIDDFLNNNIERFLVIGATYGIGKTSLAKMTVSKYSNQLLELDKSILQNSNYSNYGKYFPIIIYLRNGLNSEFNDWSLEYLFDEIIGKDNESKKRRILLILDGLDEYPDKIEELEKTIKKYVNYYYKLKIILTTRLLPGLDERLSSISNERYIRLLSFTPNKVTELIEKYINEELKLELKEKYGLDKLTFDEVSKDIGITDDKKFEITNPLFAWMLILLYSSPQLKIEFKDNWSKKFRKALIYMFFIHYVISGKFKDTEETFNLKKTYYFEKKSLRIIAKLEQLRKNELFWTDCENEIKSFFGSSVDTQLLDRTLKSILYTYFFSPFQTTDKKIKFIHKTFMEYLVSEYYLECVLFGNESAINIRKPSYATMEFLDGLIEILNSNDDDTKKRFVDFNEREQITLLNSLNYKKSQKIARNDITKTCLNCVRKKDIVFNTNTIEKKNGYYQIIPNIDNYDELWIHRWIALRILLLIQHEIINDIKDEIIELFKTSSIVSNELISGINLSEINLNGTYLTRANFTGINLSYANLNRTTLIGANLSKTTLIGANLIGANLSNVDLSLANLSGANLSGANLMGAYLSSANLTGAKLIGTSFSGAYLSRANLTGANLTGAYLSRANLISANLSHANLSKTTLIRVNLSGANLSNSIIIDIKSFKFTNVENIIWNGAIIDNLDFIDYVSEFTQNLPQKIKDKKELKIKLKERGLLDKNIEELLLMSKLPE